MSADNLVAIMEQKNGSYIVEEMTTGGDSLDMVGKFSTLREAMIAAEDYQQENEVEYGVKFYQYPPSPL